jgi:hypothetical protein
MSTEVKPNGEEMAALERIDAELKNFKRPVAEGAAAPLAAADMGELCKKYQALRKPLEILIVFLKKIPGFGAKAAAALEFLMGIADAVCPV